MMEVSLPTAIKFKSTFLPAIMTQPILPTSNFFFLPLWKGKTFCVLCHLCGLYSPPYVEHKSKKLAPGPFSEG